MLYKATVEAKDGTVIPVFSDGKTMFSRYAPLKEVENFGSHLQLEETAGGFFVVAGLGNGIHIQALRKKFPHSIILIVEKSEDEIHWLKDNFSLQSVLSMENIRLTTCTQAAQVFIQLYNPLLQGNFFFLPVRSWVDQVPEEAAQLKASLEQALASIAGDFSTQAHFGKLWFRNFFLNLQSLVTNPKNFQLEIQQECAFVAAAGPSLDSFIPQLKNPQIREKIYLIATDTALPALLRQKIIPDMAVTIDGQAASIRHFLQELPSSMVVAADISCAPDVVLRCRNKGCPVLFFRNKNPLPLLLESYLKEKSVDSAAFQMELLPEIDTGSGTVTSAAVDVAYKLGFSQIQVGGGDFAYLNGKPYCQGTYFEDQFCTTSCRINPTEQQYIQLMYRGKTFTSGGKIETAILTEYRKSFENYIKNHGDVVIITDSKKIYTEKKYYGQKLQAKRCQLKISNLSEADFKGFVDWYKSLLKEEKQEAISSILPLFGWYVKKNNAKCDIFYIMKLAYSQTVRYTETYGK